MRASEGNALRIDEFTGSRFSTALELMAEGRALAFENILFSLTKDSKIADVAVVTEWQVSNLNDARAMREIEKAVGVFEYLVENNESFRSTTEGYQPRYSLINDYGMGCIELCHLDNGKLIWNY